jgi:pantothenate kinase-related protein Tda10
VSQRYAHLNPQARKLIDAPLEERIQFIQRDRFIPYQAVSTILDLLEDFVKRPASIRPPCLALVGDSGCGKSTLMQEMTHRHTNPEEPGTRRVIYCTLDPLPELRVSQQALLTALGVPPTLALRRPRIDGDDGMRRLVRCV